MKIQITYNKKPIPFSNSFSDSKKLETHNFIPDGNGITSKCPCGAHAWMTKSAILLEVVVNQIECPLSKDDHACHDIIV